MFVLLSRFTWLLAETIFAWYTFLNGYPLPFCSSILKEKTLQGGKEMTEICGVPLKTMVKDYAMEVVFAASDFDL